MFNSYRVQYSPETHQLLKVLMDEAKISTMQRQKVNESLNKGKPLPAIVRIHPRPSNADENLFDLKRNYYFMRRTQDQIKNSGAYEPVRYRFLQPIVDKDKEKERLGNIMANGKSGEGNGRKRENGERSGCRRQSISLEERVDELIIEIYERIAFLDEMDALGKGRKYGDIIKQEIAAKLRELERLDKATAQKYIKLFKQPEGMKTNMDEVLHWG